MESAQPIELVKCTNCKVSRTPENFIGKRGGTVKRCLKCREKDDKSKKRPEVIEKNKIRQAENQYYKTYREKKRAEDPEKYLAHNADVIKNWRNNNKEHLSAWNTNNFNRRFGAIKQQARKKGILWNEDLTDEMCQEMMGNPCFYCDFISEKTLNGIDRLDNQGPYGKNNTVGCCKNCNFIKTALDPITFIQRCQHISKHFGGIGVLNEDAWPNGKCVSYSSYKARATKKNLEFSFAEEEFQEFSVANCYYCDKSHSKTHSNGIDRKTNNLGYNKDNCVSCCSECNYMKGALSENEFVEVCKAVSKHTTENPVEIPKIKKCMISVAKRQEQF